MIHREPRGRRHGPTTERLVDILTSDGGWLFWELVVDWAVELGPDQKRDTVRRTLYRLVDYGAAEMRLIEGKTYFRAVDDAWNYLRLGRRDLATMGEH